MAKLQPRRGIPTNLSVAQFEQSVLPHLSKGPREETEFSRDLQLHLRLLYSGCQWKELPLEKDRQGRPEIHYTRMVYPAKTLQA
jgi:hypothetical protein